MARVETIEIPKAEVLAVESKILRAIGETLELTYGQLVTRIVKRLAPGERVRQGVLAAAFDNLETKGLLAFDGIPGFPHIKVRQVGPRAETIRRVKAKRRDAIEARALKTRAPKWIADDYVG